jgi:predicted membrane channel-forming protein YqfA (hemolysin III family)
MSAGVVDAHKIAGSSKPWVRWVGLVFTAAPILMMLLSASMKLMRQPQMVQQFVGKFGYAESTLPLVAALELACVALYAIPNTAVLGAVLLTGYLGGATATHVRVADPGFVVPALLAVLAWGGLYLRDERLRALLPLRRRDPNGTV